ncbi:Protein kinase-like domain protein [Ophiocordyceps sinensis CO18]|uniref:Protein kinase-like domain protein n=1 Tax=Ophiocordyceps sinensis (strain Co18 / CGMCC 3.14243) TaxID=911162 RepID=T5A653_OPHSC|nr:Protein kinase-like domain protein [Ophiocordyceps sinensis CO18]
MPSDTTWRKICSYPLDTCIGRSVHECLARTNWDQLCLLASSLRQGVPCRVLPELKNGLHHLVRLLAFDDGTTWIARVRMHTITQDSAFILQREVDTMTLIRQRTSIPVPTIFAYEVDTRNPTGAAFILMQTISGNVATDSDGGYEVHQGQIPLHRRPPFHLAAAKIQLQMTSVRLPLIGMVIQDSTGDYTVGPFPHLGGPFRRATDFIEAWARHSRFPLSIDAVNRIPSAALRSRILTSIQAFPNELASSAADLITHNDGPFPIAHTDFFHSNIIVDSKYHIQGVIDWEGACTMPWELVEPPLFLETVPPELDAPNNYDENGVPVDQDTRQRWDDRRQYEKLVAKMELETQGDNMLSSTLSNRRHQKLAYAMRVYTNPGKLLFYDRVI